MVSTSSSDALPPNAIVQYKGVTFRVEGETARDFHLTGTNDPRCFEVIGKNDVANLKKSGALSVMEDPEHGFDLLSLPPSAMKRTSLKLTWVKAVQSAYAEGFILNFSRASCQKVINAQADKVRDDYLRFIANKSVAEPSKLRKTHYGASSPTRPDSYRDQDVETLVPSAKTLEADVKRWIASGYDVRSLLPDWGKQTNGGVKMNAKMWEFVENNCLIYARENQRTIAGCVEFLNALIVEENKMLGAEAHIPLVTQYAVRKAIGAIPEFAKAFTRRGSGPMVNKLRHAGTGPRFTRLGEEVLFDCWNAHLFTLLSDEVMALFPDSDRQVRLMVSVAIDQATSYIPALAIAPTGETAELTAATLEMVVTDKTPLARLAGARGSWEAIPVETTGTDNGSAYWNLRFLHGQYVLCDSADHKAAGHKQLRGGVERRLRTIDVQYIQNFIARTGSDILGRHENDPAERAAILAEFFNRLFVRWIVDVYHYKPIGKGRHMRPAPARALEEARKIQCKALPNSDRLRLAFGVVTTRTLNREGVRFMNIVYYSAWLDEPLRRKGPHDVTIRYHPRNLGQISVLLNNRWVTIPGPSEFEGKDLQTRIEYTDQIARQIKDQARVDFETYVAPALVAIDAQARQAERALGMTNIDWTDEMATVAERSLRTFVVYRRDPIGDEPGLSGISSQLGVTLKRSAQPSSNEVIDPAAREPDNRVARYSPPDTDEEPVTPIVRKAPRTRGPRHD